MLHLTNVIDRASGYVFVPRPSASDSIRPESGGSKSDPIPNDYALFSTAMGPIPSKGYDVRDVQASRYFFGLPPYSYSYSQLNFYEPYPGTVHRLSRNI